jgi:PAS domain S-box-containing protein
LSPLPAREHNNNNNSSKVEHNGTIALDGFAMADHVSCGVLITNGDGQIITANSQMADLVGYAQNDIATMSLSQLVPPATQIFIQTYILPTVFVRQSIREIYVKFKHKDGHTLPVLLNVSQMEKDGEKLFSWAIFSAQERYKLEAELVLARETAKQNSRRLEGVSQELIRSNKDLESFTEMAAHDLKAPLVIIGKVAHILETDLSTAPKDDFGQILNLMTRQVTRANRLIDGLLHYAKAGSIHGDFKTINLEEFVTDIYEFVATQDQFSFTYQGDDINFETLNVPFALVMRNLINNAIKHHGQPDGNIIVRGAESTTHYLIEVEDDGRGIAPEYHKILFNVFDRLKLEYSADGSGLGLSIVKKVVESYNGSISLTSALNEGACFHIRWSKAEILRNHLGSNNFKV